MANLDYRVEYVRSLDVRGFVQTMSLDASAEEDTQFATIFSSGIEGLPRSMTISVSTVPTNHPLKVNRSTNIAECRIGDSGPV